MGRWKVVVVGVDFTHASETAIFQAGRIAKRNDARLSVIHVIESAILLDLVRALPSAGPSLRDGILKALDSNLGTLVRKHVPAGMDFRHEVRVGVPVRELLRAVRELHADVLVLGFHGSSDPAGPAGTLATQCARKAECAVMLVRRAQEAPFRRVFACTDFSPSSSPVVHRGTLIAARDGARLTILHVFSPPWERLPTGTPTPEVSSELQAACRGALEEEMDAFLEPFRLDLDVIGTERRIIEKVHPAEAILDLLRMEAADLAIIGSTGRSALMQLQMGTTAERVVRESPCTVLVVKPEAFRFDAG